MSKTNKAPMYNLKVVLQLTGIKPDTLRAWERRYGLPLPQRTAGGHRLYSQYDVETIQWLMERQDEGMRINRAVDLWRDIEDSGKDPLDEMHPIGRYESDTEDTMVIGSSIDDMRGQWVASCLAYNESVAERILTQSFALYPVEMVCLEVMQKGIAEIGESWYRGEATVQQEHFASGLLLRRLEALISACPAPTRPEKILIACPSEEEHVLATLIATLFLRRYGWHVVNLGANVPLDDLEQAVSRIDVDLVIMVANQLYTAANLFQAACTLQRAGVPFAYAGSIFSRQEELSQRIPGYYLGDKMERVVQEVEIALKNSRQTTDLCESRKECTQARNSLEKQQLAIKADVWHQLQNIGISDTTLRLANDTLMRNILAALTLDNLDSLRTEVDWVGSLIKYQALSLGMLSEYLKVFANTIDRLAGQEARLVSDWLRQTAALQEVS